MRCTMLGILEDYGVLGDLRERSQFSLLCIVFQPHITQLTVASFRPATQISRTRSLMRSVQAL